MDYGPTYRDALEREQASAEVLREALAKIKDSDTQGGARGYYATLADRALTEADAKRRRVSDD